MRPEKARTEDKKKPPALEILVEKAARGDGDALCELCEKIAKDVLFQTTHIMGSRADAEDVAQEVLLRVCARIHDLRDPKLFVAWLGKIIANEAKKHMAENARRGVVMNIDDYLEAIMDEKDDFLPQECAENEEYHKALMDIIARLPMRQREAVIFHYYNGMNITETAEAMSISWQSVSEYLALAREKLKRELEKRRIGTELLGAAAAIPVGSLLSGVLRGEAEAFLPAGEAWIQGALAQCNAYIQANTVHAAAGAAVSKASADLLMGALATVFTAAAVTASIALNTAPTVDTGVPQIESAIETEGKVVFYGGTDNGPYIVYVNPTRAEPDTYSTGGEVIAVYWWITEKGGETALYSGEGGVVEDALLRLWENGADGEYMLFFRMEEDTGGGYTLNSNFYILAESNWPG